MSWLYGYNTQQIRGGMMPKGKSPYQRHAKAPFKYSELLEQWRAAKKAGRENDAQDLARRHAARCWRECWAAVQSADIQAHNMRQAA